jgi:hypothetical protein
MSLLDHFRPPLSQRRHWDSFHGAWAEAMAVHLNQSLLPEHFVAEARVQLGGQAGVAPWPQAVAAPPDFKHPDIFEVQVLSEKEGQRLVAAIELVSPANKDRPRKRRLFAVKCAEYLQAGLGVVLVDIVTKCSGSLHVELLQLLQSQPADAGQDVHELYATAYRTVNDQRAGTASDRSAQQLALQTWAEGLRLGGPLPTMPLWITPDLCLPLDLEASYQAACAARRIVP